MALAELGDRGGEQAGDFGAKVGCQFRCPTQQIVARQDGSQVAPLGIDALDAAAGGGVVHDVVVVQRTDVHEFHGTAATDHVDRGWRSGGIEDGGRRHREAGAHPLAARLDQMAGNLGEEIAFRPDDAKKLVLGAGEVVDHRGKDGEGMCHALHATPCADRSAKAALQDI